MGKYENPSLIIPPDITTEKDEYNEGEIVYFAFIDVLGFTAAFDNNQSKLPLNEEEQEGIKENEFINKFKDVFTYYFKLMNNAFNKEFSHSLCYAGQTSDSLYFYTTEINILNKFLKVFSHFNAYAMTKNVFFRGGIANGILYKKENYQFYGDSVIRAYLLENKIAKNPIIMIDKKTYKALGKFLADRDLLIKEEDNGRYHLKPFACSKSDYKLEFVSSEIQKTIDPDEIKNIIEKNKTIFEFDDHNYPKYTFLSNEFDA